MPLTRKLFWYCCPLPNGGYGVTVEIIEFLKDGNGTGKTSDSPDVLLLGQRVYDKGNVERVRHCPVCGTEVPTPAQLRLLETLDPESVESK